MKYHDWKILSRYPEDLISVVLKNRHITNPELFFKPDYSTLPKSDDFPGLKKAAKIIFEVKAKKQTVGLFMDYDADGICGGAIIFKALAELQIKVEAYIPKREEGYGLSAAAVEHFKKAGISLLITVDCGIRNNKEIDLSRKLGMKVIVVDHHQLGELPKADALVHPLIPRGNKLRFREYSGGGVAFLLSRELLGNSGREKWLLDLATISSVADVVPLKEVNRAIVKFGLIVIKKTKNLGLKELIRVANLDPEKISAYEIGFMIAPRINAAGRISNPRRSFELLTSRDPKVFKSAARELEDLNRERQDILEATQEEAVKKVIKGKLDQNKIIILKDKNWNEGIVGLVASRIVEKFYRPTIVLCEKGEILKGSARSISGINITTLISAADSLLLSFGGHTQAAGLSLKKDKFKAFNDFLIKRAEKESDQLYRRILKIDAILKIKQINFTLVRDLEKMQPFGPANAKAIFGFENVTIESLQYVGKEKNHCRFFVCGNGDKRQCIAFRAVENGLDIKSGEKVNIAFSLKMSYWQGQEKIDLIVEDVQKK